MDINQKYNWKDPIKNVEFKMRPLSMQANLKKRSKSTTHNDKKLLKAPSKRINLDILDISNKNYIPMENICQKSSFVILFYFSVIVDHFL